MKINVKFLSLLAMLSSSLCMQASSVFTNIASTGLQVASGMLIYKAAEVHGEEMNCIGRHSNEREIKRLKKDSLYGVTKVIKHAAASIVCAQLAIIGESHEGLALAAGYLVYTAIDYKYNQRRLKNTKRVVGCHPLTEIRRMLPRDQLLTPAQYQEMRRSLNS